MNDTLHYFDERWIERSAETLQADLCVYGATAAGIVGAITARQLGLSVVVLNPGIHVGGMTTGGLGYTDLGNKDAIGGFARAFYGKVGAVYGEQESWKFEPHVAQAVLNEWASGAGVSVGNGCYLESVSIGRGGRIEAVRMLGGLTVRAAWFIDATYEGDLMAMAGVPFSVGREANAAYGETVNGFQMHAQHQFDCDVDPYVEPGKPKSGYLYGVHAPVQDGPLELSAAAVGTREGAGDRLVQAYNFRICMTDDPALRVPFPKPDSYNRDDYELAARWLKCTKIDFFRKFDRVRPTKTDTNNHGAFSTDFIGASWSWPEGDYAAREAIFQRHVAYQQGLHYFMANDPAVPPAIRNEYARWGLASDEFIPTGGWSPQLYIREGRRMLGDYVVTEHDCIGSRACSDPVGMGAYQMDSHNCQRIVVNGMVKNEGDVQRKLPGPYPISYRSVVPPRGSVANLAVPVAVSASHIAFGSVRMEPVFMILAESTAVAIALSKASGRALQELPYADLAGALARRGQVLHSESRNTGGQNPE